MLFLKESEPIRTLKTITTALAERSMEAHVELNVDPKVAARCRELMAAGGVPVAYANHEGHVDGFGLAEISGFFIRLAAGIEAYHLNGLVVPIAKSMVTGGQGEELKKATEKFKEAAHNKGLIEIPVTRKKDTLPEYGGMSQEGVFGEVRTFVERLYGDYGIAILPEGSVQGGRHPEGASIEDIYGMQEVNNNSLMEFFDLAKRVLARRRRWPFLAPAGLHGSFRIMEAPEGGQPKLTPEGKRSLIVGAIWGSAPLRMRMQANLLMPFTEEEVALDLGPNWREDPQAFNRYAMRKVAPGIPQVARGVYANTELPQVA